MSSKEWLGLVAAVAAGSILACIIEAYLARRGVLIYGKGAANG